MTFAEIIARLSDGKAYAFTHISLNGFFFKAPYPERGKLTVIDGARSALTYWTRANTEVVNNRPIYVRHSPVFLLGDFTDRDDWRLRRAFGHPGTGRFHLAKRTTGRLPIRKQ